MAPRIKNRLRDSLGLLFFIGIFVLLVGKYFLPDQLIQGARRMANEITMNVLFLQTKAMTFFDSSLQARAQAKEDARAIPVLVYHGLPRFDDSEVTRSRFRDQMFALKRDGWNTVSLEEFYDFMYNNAELPEKSFLLTFDDGIRTSWKYADPVLKALDYKAVMFIITSTSAVDGSVYYLSRDEVEKMIESGRWKIQSHGHEAHFLIPIDEKGTLGHFLSNLAWLDQEQRMETIEEYRERIRKDFEISKEAIESFGVTSLAFAFPFGDFGQNTINLPDAEKEVEQQIKPVFPLADFFQFWASQGFTFNYPIEYSSDDFRLRRISVRSDWSGQELVDYLSRGEEKYLPYVDSFEIQRGWIDIWGDQVFEHEGMTISASEQTTGGLSFLDGAYSWTSYRFESEVVVEQGLSVSLIGRYRDVNRYASCTFHENAVLIQYQSSDIEKTIARKNMPVFNRDESFRPYQHIDGQVITCGINGDPIISAVLPEGEIAPSGGVGIKTWDPLIDNASVHALWVSVSQID
ncbi:hypothetical protein CO172_00070 [Candidatus Uhrbacteria bacterium CG_4_9_14_3_um_filter_36_7]|uniref:NodB homology domain-containing protein n=1 Tax=Candidatus Uhrbacteria bacterium CG_4_9_14_3_um_filter_36_7 TaxID=1975033 RepID=A0A2M7XIH5_9BACT|nr:MAG: hypothetical protein CO172_00070 [Candidatus Uhrbacteria bacterium CG_4_9_14_3_um_filter_36_7]